MPSFPSNLSLFIEVKAFKSSHSVIASSHNFQNLCFHWRGMFLSSPLSLLPASSFHCCGFWDVDICTWFAGVTIAHACILLFSLIRSRFIHNVILLFITTSIIIHGLVQLWVGIVSSISCPAILESSSCPHSSSLMVWNASSYSYSTPVLWNVSFFSNSSTMVWVSSSHFGALQRMVSNRTFFDKDLYLIKFRIRIAATINFRLERWFIIRIRSGSLRLRIRLIMRTIRTRFLISWIHRFDFPKCHRS